MNCVARYWLSPRIWQEKKFIDTIADQFLSQHVNFATRESNVLDLVLAGEGSTVSEVRRGGKLGTSDHDMIEFCIECAPDDIGPPPTIQCVPNFSRADFVSIRRELFGRNWQHELHFMNATQSWTHLKNIIECLVKMHVPIVQRRTTDKPMWMTGAAARAVQVKQRRWRSYRAGKTNLSEYRTAEKKSGRIKKNQ